MTTFHTRLRAVRLMLASGAICLGALACTPGTGPDATAAGEEVSAGGNGPSPPDDGSAVSGLPAGASADPAGGSGSAAADSDGASAAPAATGSVARVVDGDTLDVTLPSGVERVRLIGIDTPESVKPDSEVECYGVAASQHLADLLPRGTEVELVRDVELRDRYDRLLAYVFRSSDGLFVNLSMAAEGYANSLSIAPNVTFADDMSSAVAQARRSGLGLWKDCPEPDALFG